MATEKIRVGDVGVRIIVDAGLEVASASELRIYYEKPSGVSGYWDAQEISENSNYIEHVTTAGEIDESGEWRIQSWAQFPTWYGSGTPTVLRVGENIYSN